MGGRGATVWPAKSPGGCDSEPRSQCTEAGTLETPGAGTLQAESRARRPKWKKLGMLRRERMDIRYESLRSQERHAKLQGWLPECPGTCTVLQEDSPLEGHKVR